MRGEVRQAWKRLQVLAQGDERTASYSRQSQAKNYFPTFQKSQEHCAVVHILGGDPGSDPDCILWLGAKRVERGPGVQSVPPDERWDIVSIDEYGELDSDMT